MQQIRFLSLPLFVCFLSILISNTAVSQTDTIRFQGHMYARVGITSSPEMKEFNDSNESAIPAHFHMKETSIDIHAVRHFKKNYKDAVNEIWTQGRNGFTATFYKHAISNVVRYTPSGKWINTIKRYYEPQMPKEIRSIVKPVYYDYSIVVVNEISENGFSIPAYFIHLKQGLTYKIIRVFDNETEVIQTIKLQN